MFIAQRFAFLYNLYIDIARFLMSNFARVFLNAKEEKEIQTGFPWVFDNEISHVKYRKSEKVVGICALGSLCRGIKRNYKMVLFRW